MGGRKDSGAKRCKCKRLLHNGSLVGWREMLFRRSSFGSLGRGSRGCGSHFFPGCMRLMVGDVFFGIILVESALP